MEKILVNDRWFKPYLGAGEISRAIGRMAERMNVELREQNPLFVVVLNGAFIFAADLMRQLDFPCRISFVRLASYDGTNSTQQIKNLIGLHEDLAGENVVIVEDIVDTGHTLEYLLQHMEQHQPASVRIATLLFKPAAFVHDFKIDYVALEIPPDFIVGYGLDYDGHGRNLPDIYQIVND